MGLCTLAEFRHEAADEIEANLTEFMALLLRYMRTCDREAEIELCDRFSFRCMPAYGHRTFRHAVIGNVTYLIGG